MTKDQKFSGSVKQVIQADNVVEFSAWKEAKIINNGGINVFGGVVHVTQAAEQKPQARSKKEAPVYPANSIGQSSDLVVRIELLLQQIIDFQYQRYGKKFNGAIVYSELGRAFGFSAKTWKQIYKLDISMAPEVIGWLESRRDKTYHGRTANAASKPGYVHTRPHMFRVEKEWLEQLGWDDKQRKQQLNLIIGKESRRHMTNPEFLRWINHLERQVQAMYGE